MVKKLNITGVFILAAMFFVSKTFAQNDKSFQQPAISGDPIVEMLDSLVTLNNVIRYQSSFNSSGISQSESSIIPYFSEEVYRDRLSKISTPISLDYNEQVKTYIDLYATKKRELTARVLGLSHLYFPLFEEILDKEGLPLEFKNLAIVESALNPTAVSRAGATGIWQFMLSTGKLYDLKVTSYTDERRDPVKATYAACKYFKDMYDIYRDWLLVIAAYNCGAGNVNRAIIRSGGKTNFWEISRFLPAETRGYVPAFIAVCYVMNYAAEHNITAVSPSFSYFEVDTLRVRQKTTLSKISKNVDLPLDVVQYLNPTYKKGIVPETSEPQVIRLPANRVSSFISNENSIYLADVAEPTPVLSRLKFNKNADEDQDGSFVYSYKKVRKIHKVKRGESISGVADKYNCSVTDIKKLNRLKSGKLQAGQKLNVYAWMRVKEPVKTNENNITTAKLNNDTAQRAIIDSSVETNQVAEENIKTTDTLLASNDTSSQNREDKAAEKPVYIYHLVQRGDTLWNIAKRYDGATVDQIMELNKMRDNRFLKTGTKIKVKVAG